VPNFDVSKSRELRDKVQPIYEEVAALLGAAHPAAVALQQAATELATAAPGPRRYGDHEPDHPTM
jgi:mannose/cellobiose epimerase-like protein (N-acyl-D-glucosamine 2-epimerase family)